MKSLQPLDLCFLLLCLASNALPSSEFAISTCNGCRAKLGENASILCKSTREITTVKVTFCSHYDDNNCSEERINTEKGINAIENGRIWLKKNNNSLYLNIHNVEIFDNRQYIFLLVTNYGFRDRRARLEVNAPYTIYDMRQQNNTTIVCEAAGGFPKSQLYWFDKNGTNLTSSSKLETRKAPDGSFFLSSALQVETPIRETYCCSFNNTTCSDTYSVWTASQIPTFDKHKSKEHGFSIYIAITVALVVGVAIAIFYMFYRRKKDANYVNWRRVNKTLTNQSEEI